MVKKILNNLIKYYNKDKKYNIIKIYMGFLLKNNIKNKLVLIILFLLNINNNYVYCKIYKNNNKKDNQNQKNDNNDNKLIPMNTNDNFDNNILNPFPNNEQTEHNSKKTMDIKFWLMIGFMTILISGIMYWITKKSNKNLINESSFTVNPNKNISMTEGFKTKTSSDLLIAIESLRADFFKSLKDSFGDQLINESEDHKNYIIKMLLSMDDYLNELDQKTKEFIKIIINMFFSHFNKDTYDFNDSFENIIEKNKNILKPSNYNILSIEKGIRRLQLIDDKFQDYFFEINETKKLFNTLILYKKNNMENSYNEIFEINIGSTNNNLQIKYKMNNNLNFYLKINDKFLLDCIQISNNTSELLSLRKDKTKKWKLQIIINNPKANIFVSDLKLDENQLNAIALSLKNFLQI